MKSLKQRPLAILACLFLLCHRAPAQRPSPAVPQSGSTLREVHVIITDKGGHFLRDVKKEDVLLTEDGVSTTIESFTLMERPAIYGLVIDTSLSLTSQFSSMVNAAKMIVDFHQPGDQAFISRFTDSSHIELAQALTSEKPQLLNALSALRLAKGQTALIDAVYVNAEDLIKLAGVNGEVKPRQAMVLITDGEDRRSYYTESQLFALLRKGDFRIFVVGLVKELENDRGFIKPSRRESATMLIDRLAKETGGRAFVAEKPEDFAKAANEIAHDLHLQYVVNYRSTNRKPGDHKLEIKLNDPPDQKRKAILRPKYREEQLATQRWVP